MSGHRRLSLLLILLCGWGCQSLGSGSDGTTTDRNDPWVQDVGTYARGEHTPEPVNDPLNLRKFLVSEQTRDIERNLGIGD
jgi:hypothetical protein